MIKDKFEIYDEDDWELLGQYILLVLKANRSPKWGHYEVINNDLFDNKKEKLKKELKE